MDFDFGEVATDFGKFLKRVTKWFDAICMYVSMCVSVVTQGWRDKLGLGNERSPCEDVRRRAEGRAFRKGVLFEICCSKSFVGNRYF